MKMPMALGCQQRLSGNMPAAQGKESTFFGEVIPHGMAQGNMPGISLIQELKAIAKAGFGGSNIILLSLLVKEGLIPLESMIWLAMLQSGALIDMNIIIIPQVMTLIPWDGRGNINIGW